MSVVLKSGDRFYGTADYPWHLLYEPEIAEKRGKYGAFYLNTPAAFDIETTTIEKDGIYTGFMYRWMFSFQHHVCMGGKWEEFIFFIKRLRKHMHTGGKRKIVIFVHNLAFEYQFMRGFFKTEIRDIFYKDVRKPIRFTIDGFEFRCSYFLSNMSLQKFCENSCLCKHGKISGDDYDYRKIRTFSTEFTDTELQYQYNDVAGLEECIESMLLEDTMATLPLTNTGFVRRACKKAMAENKANRSAFIRNRLSLDQYRFLKKIFRGGDTHASRFYADVHLYNMDSYDLQSSYPAWIMTEYFPFGKLMKITHTSSIERYRDTKCLFLKLAFFDISVYPEEGHTYIDLAHVARYHNIKTDNGRILSADYIEYYCTEIDLAIIEECYDYKGYRLMEGYMCNRGKLPEELKRVTMEFYEAKTTLKNVEEKIYEYVKSKNRLNAIFGMMVSALIHDEIVLTEDGWKRNPGIETPEQLEEWEKGELNEFYHSFSGFLSYQWGIYVTAHARKHLREGIRAAGKKAVYWDTDCVKFLSDKDIITKFEEMNRRYITCIMQETSPPVAYKDGKPYYMGVWDRERHIEEFKTYGAKKYCFISVNKKGEKEFTITVAGMSKKKGALAVQNFNPDRNPVDNFILGAEYHNVGRTTSYYDDDDAIREITVNGDTFLTAAGIGIVETTYTLGITNEYDDLIREVKGELQ